MREEYLGFKIQPKDIFISGIMYRICEQLELEGIRIEDAFSENNRNDTVFQIIKQELARSNYEITPHNFRYHVRSYLEVFTRQEK